MLAGDQKILQEKTLIIFDEVQDCPSVIVSMKYFCESAPGLPIAAYDDLSAFKIYLADVGLLRRLALLAPTAFGEGNRLFTEFKGALTENYCLQALINQLYKELYGDRVSLRVRFSLDNLRLDNANNTNFD